MPTDPGFWVHLFEGMTSGAKIIICVLVVIAVLGGKALTVIAAYVKETRHEAVEARKEATLAAERSLPTGNGFADGVMGYLRRIEQGQEQNQKETQEQLSAIKAELQRQAGDTRRLTTRVTDLEKPQ